MVVHDDHIRLRRGPTRAEEKALVEVLTLETAAEIGLRRNFIPHFRTWWRRQVGEGSIGGARCPCTHVLQLTAERGIEQSGGRVCVLQAPQAEVVAPALQEHVANGLIVERPLQEWEVL